MYLIQEVNADFSRFAVGVYGYDVVLFKVQLLFIQFQMIKFVLSGSIIEFAALCHQIHSKSEFFNVRL